MRRADVIVVEQKIVASSSSIGPVRAPRASIECRSGECGSIMGHLLRETWVTERRDAHRHLRHGLRGKRGGCRSAVAMITGENRAEAILSTDV